MTEASSGKQTLKILNDNNIDLVTLDLSLGSEDWLDIARQIRLFSKVPIVMVSGKGDLIDTVVGLEVGADDYISKPFELREVIARVRAVLRRYQSSGPAQHDTTSTEHDTTSDTVFRFDDWTLNCNTRELQNPGGEIVALTTGEFDLLQVFVTHARQVLSRDQIMDNLRGNEWAPNDRTIDNQVDVFDISLCNVQGIEHPCRRNNGCAVLIIVHDRNIAFLNQSFLNQERFRCLNIL